MRNVAGNKQNYDTSYQGRPLFCTTVDSSEITPLWLAWCVLRHFLIYKLMVMLVQVACLSKLYRPNGLFSGGDGSVEHCISQTATNVRASSSQVLRRTIHLKVLTAAYRSLVRFTSSPSSSGTKDQPKTIHMRDLSSGALRLVFFLWPYRTSFSVVGGWSKGITAGS